METDSLSLSHLIGDLQINEATQKTEEMLSKGVAPGDIHREIMRGLALVGEKYNQGQCFIADLMVSGLLARELLFLVHGQDLREDTAVSGKVVIGTICDDIHDIGKDLISDSLKFSGVQVVDLGVDVPVSVFIAAAEKYRPDLLAISTVMDSSFTHIRHLISSLRAANVPADMKIVVGGAAANPRFAKVDGVDYLTNDYQKGMDYFLSILRQKYQQGSIIHG